MISQRTKYSNNNKGRNMTAFKTFKTFITEASFSKGNFNKAVDRIVSVLEKRLGATLYRYGGTDDFVEFSKNKAGDGIGILYFIDGTKRAFRLNYEPKRAGQSVEITSIDFWDGTWNIDFPIADYTLNLSGINIVQVIDSVADFLKGALKESTALSKSALILEKSRTTPEKFAQKAREAFGNNIDSLGKDDLKKLADELDVQVPSKIWQETKSGRNEYDLTIFSDGSETLEVEKGETEFVKPSKEAKKAESSVEPDDSNELFQDLADLVELVAQDLRPSLMVVGGAGTGKTHTVINTVKDQGLVEEEDYIVSKGKASTYGLYEMLFLHSDKLIIFDDSDDVLKADDSRNLLKAALDSSDERIISWVSKATQNIPGNKEEREEQIEEIRQSLLAGQEEDDSGKKLKLPSKFEFTGRIIFVSNIPREKHEEALISRSLTIDVTLNKSQMFNRIRGIMENVEPEMDKDKKREVIEFLESENVEGNLQDVTLRSFLAALKIRKSGNPRWKNLVKYGA